MAFIYFVLFFQGAFSMHSQSKDGMATDSSIILTGLGNVRHHRENHFTAIQWQVRFEECYNLLRDWSFFSSY